MDSFYEYKYHKYKQKYINLKSKKDLGLIINENNRYDEDNNDYLILSGGKKNTSKKSSKNLNHEKQISDYEKESSHGPKHIENQNMTDLINSGPTDIRHSNINI